MPLPDPSLEIRVLTADDLPHLGAFARGHEDDPDYFKAAFEEQQDGKRLVFLAFLDGHLTGYVHYNRHPKYQPFRSLGLPEIQDLYVGSSFRRQGVGGTLVRACEDQARRDSCSDIGIGVGVGRNFGAAQRLYTHLGYVPDGAGAVFDRLPVSVGEVRPVDDSLCLMMVKEL